MTVLSDNRSIIVISKDISFSALMTGYCRSKKLTVTCLNTLNGSSSCDDLNATDLMVIDARYSAEQFASDFHQIIDIASHSSGLPILVVYRQNVPPQARAYSNLTFIEEFEILPELDRLFNNTRVPGSGYERRVKERRRCPDRRISSNHNGQVKKIETRADSPVQIGDICVNYQTKTVFKNNRDLQLTRKEFDLFTMLLSERSQVYTAEFIMKQLWPNTSRANKSDLYQYIHTLRKKLEPDPCDPKCLLTVKGVGYQLCL